MKLKKSLKDRTCSNCQEPIAKGSLYGQRSKTLISDSKGQCIGTEYREEYAFPLRISKKYDYCERCAL